MRDNILGHLQLLRNSLFNMGRAADHLENWVNGVLDLEPLLDVKAFLCCLHFDFLFFTFGKLQRHIIWQVGLHMTN